MSTAAPTNAPTPTPAPARRRVLVLHEAGPAGTAALDLARELDLQEGADLTVVAVVPTAASGSRCGGSALEFNAIVKETVANELDRARERLGHAAGRTKYALLVEGEDPALEQWIVAGSFDLILLPARRRLLRAPGHPSAGRLRDATDAEVRIVQRPR
ncbi:MAG: hypothetical protein ACTHQQ_17105 [Solirubrobacteraceae bacterium]